MMVMETGVLNFCQAAPLYRNEMYMSISLLLVAAVMVAMQPSLMVAAVVAVVTQKPSEIKNWKKEKHIL